MAYSVKDEATPCSPEVPFTGSLCRSAYTVEPSPDIVIATSCCPMASSGRGSRCVEWSTRLTVSMVGACETVGEPAAQTDETGAPRLHPGTFREIWPAM